MKEAVKTIKTKEQAVHIIYASNDGYAGHLAASLCSLLDNNRHINDLDIYVLSAQMCEAFKERLKNLAAGFSSIIAFRANDVTTRNYISNLYGKNMVLEQYQKMNGEWEEERRMGNTVEDWDLNSLKVGEAIVGLPFEQPFRFYFEKYSGQY